MLGSAADVSGPEFFANDCGARGAGGRQDSPTRARTKAGRAGSASATGGRRQPPEAGDRRTRARRRAEAGRGQGETHAAPRRAGTQTKRRAPPQGGTPFRTNLQGRSRAALPFPFATNLQRRSGAALPFPFATNLQGRSRAALPFSSPFAPQAHARGHKRSERRGEGANCADRAERAGLEKRGVVSCLNQFQVRRRLAAAMPRKEPRENHTRPAVTDHKHFSRGTNSPPQRLSDRREPPASEGEPF